MSVISTYLPPIYSPTSANTAYRTSNSNSSAPLESNVNTRPNNVESQLDDVPASQMVLYPNPTQKVLNVNYEIDKEYKLAAFVVYSLQGVELDRINLPSSQGKITLDVSAYRNGRYIGQLVVDGKAEKKGVFAIAR